MTQIKDKKVYNAAMARIEELLPLVTDDTPKDDVNAIELDLLTSMVADYEEVHYPIATPSLGAIMKLRMYEMGLTQDKVASMIGISTSKIRDIISEKSEPTLKVARKICLEMNIDANIALGI